jgi:glycosyltransferase involved in cell wall biosynthesis
VTFDITAIVNLHAEGYLCKPTLDSVARCTSIAAKNGINVEVILILDHADGVTKEFVYTQLRKGWIVKEISVRDLGQARNVGVSVANGSLVAFLDGDDLWCSDWLLECVRAARRVSRFTIWHPEYNLYFGEDARIFRHIDMEDSEYSHIDLLFSNLWTALACTNREVLLETPYPATDLKSQIGYEDWGWNLKTIEAGFTHKIVPNTVHAVRIKPGYQSLVSHTTKAGAVPSPTLLFKNNLQVKSEHPAKALSHIR